MSETETPAEGTEPEKKRVNWTYTGQRFYALEGKKDRALVHAWSDHTGKERLYPVKRGEALFGINPAPGAVYELSVSEPTPGRFTVHYGEENRPSFLRRRTDDEVATWSALDYAARREAERLKGEKQKNAVDLFRAHLDPLRKAYNEASPFQRAALLGEIVRYITSGGGL